MVADALVPFAAAAVCAAAARWWAQRRVAAQPVDVDPAAEDLLVTAAETRPGLAAAVTAAHTTNSGGDPTSGAQPGDAAGPVTAAMFTGSRPARWAAALDPTPPPTPAGTDDIDDSDRTGGGDGDPAVDAGLLDAADRVVRAAADRDRYRGTATLTETGDDARPLRWAPTRPSLGGFAVSVAAAAGFAALLAGPVAVAAGWVGVAALVVWLTVGVAAAAVDRATLCIDLPTITVGYTAVAALVVAAVGFTPTVVAAAGIAGTVTGLLAAGSLLYTRLRGVTGLGTGDLLLLPALIAVPVALGAPVDVAAWGLVAAGTLFVAETVAVRRDTTAPAPFGPALLAGYPAAWAVLALL